MINLVSELVTAQSSLQLFSDEQSNAELTAISENLQSLSRQFRDISFGMRLVPIQSIMVKFRRLVRDLSQQLGKEVHFTTEGTETELDKNIIENLSDPLMHLIRNSLDHGIEDKEERLRLKKQVEGNIHFRAFYSGSHVHIIIKDDGRGIDTDKIKKMAIRKQFLNADEGVGEKELLELLFQPGFTTKDNASELSGRGVGMDVVKRKIEELNGEIELKSQKGYGTETILRLPLTLSIIDGFMVSVGNTSFIIPLSAVDKIYELDIKQIDNAFKNITEVDGGQIQFLHLASEMNISTEPQQQLYLITVMYEDQKIGLVVDKVIGECQAVLKPLGKYLKDQEIFSGASILGDGSVALVIDSNKLIKRYIN